MRDEGKSPTQRLFYALWPDIDTRATLTRLMAQQIAPGAGKPTPSEHLHLTLAFLGNQPVGLLPALQALLQEMAFAAPLLRLDHFGHFSRARILWAGMQPSPALSALHRELHGRLARLAGLRWQCAENFVPHVTLLRQAEGMPLARQRHSGDGPRPRPTPPFDPILWQADCIALVRSTTTPAGAHYEIVAQQRAQPAAGGDVA